jgi:lipoprotein-anchoring transpeptidase ErfK/SrfK
MAWASQTARPAFRRHGGGKPPRRSPWVWIAVTAGCLGLAGIAWWLVEDHFTTPATARADGASVATPESTAPPVTVRRFDVLGTAATPVEPPRSAASPPHSAQAPAAAPKPSTPPTVAVGGNTLRDPATAAGAGMKLIELGKLVEGRAALSDVLVAGQVSTEDAQVIRETLASINDRLVFSKDVVEGDPFTKLYTVQPGDRLVRVANDLLVPYQFIEQINGVESRRLRAGQKIKVIQGPFHAVVHKSEFRLDLFLAGADGRRVYVRSFPVGLGEDNSTPEGSFVIKPGGKVQGGGWTNPRTGETFAPGDPRNPIGKYWMALQGNGPRTHNASGYGIHGTIQPESIGHQMSMGCIRLRDDDIMQVYKMLFEGKSTVEIVP